ncbi:discoidin domain-containing protein [uncultured Prevotellamassilia sp.]|uniref:discoidin domain-containing protein n=1 Tax=uncultured Prevotellamassilia sp. TaxID=1926676 RepID=UPI0025985014|nr:discoidin domain-containing protein [uncultured Prevotellamassilia sp.]
MKKITFMLSLLMSMGAMTTSAQVLSRTGWTVTVSGENANDGGGKAAIIDGNNSTYWHSRYDNNGTGDATKSLPQFFVIDLGQETSFKSIGYVPRPGLQNGTAATFKLYVSNTEFESVSDSKNAASIVNALGNPAMTGTFTYANGEGQTVKTASSETELTGRYVMFVITGGKDNNSFASCAEFYLSKDASIAAKSITYHYKVDGTEMATKTAEVVIPEEQVPNLGILTNGAVNKVDDSNYEVTCTSNIPFTAAESYDATTAKWYVIDMHNNQGNLLWKGNADNSIAIETIGKTTTPSLSDNYQWTFVGNLTDGYKLYNKATNKAAAFSGDALALSETGDAFKIVASTAANKANGFCFYKTEGNYLNHQGSGVKTWTKTDEGSTMHVQAPESYPLAYAQTFANYSDEGAPEGAIGANTYLSVADNLNTFKAAYAAASAEEATAEQIKTLEAQNAKVAAGNTSTMEVGKYYRLYNKQHHKYACLNDNPAQVTSKLSGTVNSMGASSVFYIENAEAGSGRYRIKVGGLTLGKASMSTNIALGDDNYGSKGGYVISHVGKTFLFFDQVTGTNYSYIHGGDNGERMVGWEANSDASRWYVIPATDVEIDMTAQGDKKYASAYLPFAVSNVAGATAYTGALNADKNAIDMTATTAVPANTGFVLVGTAEKATLTIGKATAIAGENVLIGTNTGIAFAEATPKANYLVFGVNNGTVGFYTPGNVTAIPANKAYINASAITGSAIALNFGNTVTGINAATINNGENNAPIYDLSGRRVWAPVKGGLYIQNGKKLVK